MEIFHIKILQQSGQVFSSGSDTVKFNATFKLYDLIIVVVYVPFVINVLVRMHKIHVKKDPSKP